MLILPVALTDRPSVAGALLQTPSSFINWLTHPFPPNHQITFLKPWELESWIFQRRFTCHVSGVMCQVSRVTFFFFFSSSFLPKVVDGLLWTGPTQSSFFLCQPSFSIAFGQISSCSLLGNSNNFFSSFSLFARISQFVKRLNNLERHYIWVVGWLVGWNSFVRNRFLIIYYAKSFKVKIWPDHFGSWHNWELDQETWLCRTHLDDFCV